MRGIDSHIGYADAGISRYIDLERRTRIKGHVGADPKNSVETRRIGRSYAYRNYHGAIDLATRKLKPSCQRDRCHPAHTSETHRHPEEKVLVRMIATESIIVTIAARPR
jgi:hypothetical protein